MKFLCLIIILLMPSFILAKEVYPKGCVPWAIHDAVPVLKNKKVLIVMLHNLSDSDLWITHPTKNAGAQAGFSSLLSAGKWSALALGKMNTSFPLMCVESHPGHEQQIPCTDVLALCQWPKSKLPDAAESNFWAGENMDLNPLKAYIERLGLILEDE